MASGTSFGSAMHVAGFAPLLAAEYVYAVGSP